MKIINSLIIDDEPNNCDNLSYLLNRYCPEVTIIGTAGDVKQALSLIKSTCPDLIFLDIQMPGGSGFDLLDLLNPVSFDVIFVTAFDQYAIRALRMCALDYLLKPIDVLELRAAVDRALQKEGKENIAINQFLENKNAKDKRIALPTAERIVYVMLSEIIRCLGENNYTTVYLKSGKSILVSRTLKEYEELLGTNGFIRVHQSHLINIKYIRSYEKADGGYLKLTDGSSIPVSRQRKSLVLDQLNHLVNS